jgi:hypothetical protein
MNTLAIKDLPLALEMDRAEMTVVIGGKLPQQILNIIQAVSDYASDSPTQHSFTGSGTSVTY